jgi:hypothetical protein
MSLLGKRAGVGSWVVASVLGLGVACGGSQERPGVPPPAEEGPEEESDESWETEPDRTSSEPEEESGSEPSESASEAPKEPVFTEGMSVNDAIAAVPSHYEFIGMEQEVLAKPLVDVATYKECNVNQSTHFTVRIAVWNGKVVGADVSAKGNKKLEQCIDGVVRKLEYKEKVESINTVEFSL